VSRLPVRWRLTAAFACVMAILLVATGAFVRQQLQAHLDNTLAASLRAHAADVAALAQQSDTGLADARRAPAVGQLPQLAQIIDARGHVIDATAGLPQRPLLAAAQLARARNGSVAIRRTLIAGDQPVRLLGVPVTAQGQRLVVIVGQSLEERDGAIADLTSVLLLGGPAALVLASLAGYALTGAALRPVEVMRRRERAFIADAGHELRSPLAMLRTELELMARDRPAGAQLQTATASAIEETDRLTRLADELLLLSRADGQRFELRVEQLSTAELVRAALGRARRRQSAGGIRIAETDVADGVLVSADPDRAGQALDNMLENALRYATSEVVLATRATGRNVEIHVLDDGPGFPAQFLPRVWERFSRADTARTDGGSGLGLSIVRTIAERHGGSAGAGNRPGGGADVWISFPTAHGRSRR
jgi:signal transduction histidine kinase